MNKTKLTCAVIIVGVVVVPLLTCCGQWIVSDVHRSAALDAAEERAQAVLSNTKAVIPLVTGDVMLDHDSGVSIQETMQCTSYLNEELHATNDLEFEDVLDYYSTVLPKMGWISSESFNVHGRAFSKDGNILLSIYPARQYYWYALCPFGANTCQSMKFPPDKPTLDVQMARYMTVFALELATFPPPDLQCAGN